jgi:hypothetical protein
MKRQLYPSWIISAFIYLSNNQERKLEKKEMSNASIIISSIVLSFIGYVALKYGFHEETAKEKMINTIHPISTPKKYPKGYAILAGAACWLTAIYAIVQFFLK